MDATYFALALNPCVLPNLCDQFGKTVWISDLYITCLVRWSWSGIFPLDVDVIHDLHIDIAGDEKQHRRAPSQL